MNNLANNILEKIKTGEITMQSRWHFIFKTVWMSVGVILLACIAVYLFSFLLFTFNQNDTWLLPGFGYSGIVLLVTHTPWLIISLLGLFLLLLYILVSHYSFCYRKPLVYSLIGMVLFVVVVSSVIQYFQIHQRVQSYTVRHNVPGLRPFYATPASHRPSGLVRGLVASTTDDGFLLNTNRPELLKVILDKIDENKNEEIQLGSLVLVFGERKDDILFAREVRLLEGTYVGKMPDTANEY